jgi:membrane-associated phospholipid phosphatase
LPSATTAALLAVGGGSALVVHSLDDNLDGWVHRHGESGYTSLGRVAGDGWVQGATAVGTYLVGLASRDRETEHLGSDLIRGQFLVALSTRALKIAVDRTRPSGGGHSFPSGHSSAPFLTAAVIDGHYGWKAGLPAYAAAGFISWTRLRDREHWLSDVIAGGTLGVIVGRTVTAHRDRSQTWVVSPSVTPGGFGVFVVKQ